MSRRALIGQGVTVLTASAAAATIARAQHVHEQVAAPATPPDTVAPRPRLGGARVAPGVPGRDYTPVIVPNGATLPFRVVDRVKVFHLTAGECRHEFTPGLTATCWGYNGRTPGPVLEAVEGDRIRVYVTNRLPEATSIHWHGLLVPSGMDGTVGVSQPPIRSGETFVYEFDLEQHGTFLYHPHYDEMTQQALGMMGMIVVHPRGGRRRPARDFALLSSEWRIALDTARPDPNEMTDFNILTFNSRAFPGTAPLVIQRLDDVRIRFGNLGAMSHHPIHVHGLAWRMTATDGGEVPRSAQFPESTTLVPVGTTRTVEFTAEASGDWAMHCHMTHHTMNQMGHSGVNLIGVDRAKVDGATASLLPQYMTMGQTGMGDHGLMGMPVPANSVPMAGVAGPKGHIDMGGMFTLLKVRDRVTGQADPGWYADPPGTVARAATAEELRRDGVAP
ncbi:MAG: copper oxidase [Gemmatimonadaceae bacterium]|nr:copper oxidase [Gemmatimonadaceae bacterium]